MDTANPPVPAPPKPFRPRLEALKLFGYQIGISVVYAAIGYAMQAIFGWNTPSALGFVAAMLGAQLYAYRLELAHPGLAAERGPQLSKLCTLYTLILEIPLLTLILAAHEIEPDPGRNPIGWKAAGMIVIGGTVVCGGLLYGLTRWGIKNGIKMANKQRANVQAKVAGA